MSKFIWTTKDGKNLLIRRMETSHIENCMRLIERKDYVSLEAFGCEDFYDEQHICLRDVYELMHLELRIRKLEAHYEHTNTYSGVS